MKLKAFFILFTGLSVARNCLRPKNGPLTAINDATVKIAIPEIESIKNDEDEETNTEQDKMSPCASCDKKFHQFVIEFWGCEKLIHYICTNLPPYMLSSLIKIRPRHTCMNCTERKEKLKRLIELLKRRTGTKAHRKKNQGLIVFKKTFVMEEIEENKQQELSQEIELNNTI